MLTSELVELVGMIRRQKAEGQTIEVKAAEKGCPQKLYDTLSSFSNQDVGGTIVFGLDEKQDFALVGVYDLQELQKMSQSSAIRWIRQLGLFSRQQKLMERMYVLRRSRELIFQSVLAITRVREDPKALIFGLEMQICR